MQVLIWVLVYVLAIVAMATWREHHDAGRTRRNRRTGPASHPNGEDRRAVTWRVARGLRKHSHRTS